jgi:hypothetical protein
MFSVILYMLRQTLRHLASPLPYQSFSPLTVTFPKLAVILRPQYWCESEMQETKKSLPGINLSMYSAMLLFVCHIRPCTVEWQWQERALTFKLTRLLGMPTLRHEWIVSTVQNIVPRKCVGANRRKVFTISIPPTNTARHIAQICNLQSIIKLII